MKQFIARMKEEKTPHERRQFSFRVASIITAVLFVGWLATLSVRLATTDRPVVFDNNANAANALVAVQGNDAGGQTQVQDGSWWAQLQEMFGR